MAYRRKIKRNSSANFIPLILLFLFVGWSMSHAPVLLYWCIFLVVIAASVYVALKLYPRWVEIQRFRAFRLDDIDNMQGHLFEHYVAKLMEQQGFRTTVTKGSGDLGVDIIAHKAGIGYAVQCKRYSDNIPRNAISDAVAGKHHYKCSEAMVVTNRYFTAGAIELAKSTKCILIDRKTLATWVSNFQRQNSAKQLQQDSGQIS